MVFDKHLFYRDSWSFYTSSNKSATKSLNAYFLSGPTVLIEEFITTLMAVDEILPMIR